MSTQPCPDKGAEAERAARLIKELSRISMSLAADLVQAASYTFQGHDYLDRDAVTERVMQWRTEWDATTDERAALLEAARRAPAPVADDLPALRQPLLKTRQGTPAYTAGQMLDYARDAIAADRQARAMTPMCERKTGMLESEGYGKTGYVLRQPGKDREVVVCDGGAVSWFTLDQWNWLMFNRDHVEFQWPKPIGALASVPAAGAVQQPAEDPVVEANRRLLLERSQVGISKYGTTLADAGLTRAQLLQHGLEEALDLANYLQTLLQQEPPCGS